DGMQITEVDHKVDRVGAGVVDDDHSGRRGVGLVPVEACLLEQRVGIAEPRREGPDLLPDGQHPFVPSGAQGKGVDLRSPEGTGERRWGRERLEGEEIIAALGEARVRDDQDALGAVGLRPLKRHPAADPDEALGTEGGRLEALIARGDPNQGDDGAEGGEGGAREAVRHASNLRGAARGVNLTPLSAGNNVRPPCRSTSIAARSATRASASNRESRSTDASGRPAPNASRTRWSRCSRRSSRKRSGRASLRCSSACETRCAPPWTRRRRRETYATWRGRCGRR